MKARAEQGWRRSDGDVNVGREERRKWRADKSVRRRRRSFHWDVTFIPDWIFRTAVMKARFAQEPRPSSPTSNRGFLGNTKRCSKPVKSTRFIEIHEGHT